MTVEGDARFCGRPAARPASWLVCKTGSAHVPNVKGGRALVRDLLPDGRIDFTR